MNEISTIEDLTGPEILVMNLAGQGLENKMIAGELGISLASVRKRLEIISDKLNLHGKHYRVVLAHLALHRGMTNLFERTNRKVKP